MKRLYSFIFLLGIAFILSGCSPQTQMETETPVPTRIIPTETPVPTKTITPTAADTDTPQPSPTSLPVVETIAPVDVPVCSGAENYPPFPKDFIPDSVIAYTTSREPGHFIQSKLFFMGGNPVQYQFIPTVNQEYIKVYGFSPDGKWLAYSPYQYNEEADFLTPYLVLRSSDGQTKTYEWNSKELVEERNKIEEGFDSPSTFTNFHVTVNWINASLLHADISSPEWDRFEMLFTRILDGSTGKWQDEYIQNLPDREKKFISFPPQISERLSPDTTRMLYHPDGKFGLALWDVIEKKVIWEDQTLRIGYDTWLTMNWAPDSKAVAIKYFDVKASKTKRLIISRDGQVMDFSNTKVHYKDPESWHEMIWSPDSRYLAFPADKNLILFDVQEKKFVYTCPFPAELSGDIYWSPDGKWIVLGVSDIQENINDMYLLNVGSGETYLVMKDALPAGWSDQFTITSP